MDKFNHKNENNLLLEREQNKLIIHSIFLLYSRILQIKTEGDSIVYPLLILFLKNQFSFNFLKLYIFCNISELLNFFRHHFKKEDCESK